MILAERLRAIRELLEEMRRKERITNDAHSPFDTAMFEFNLLVEEIEGLVLVKPFSHEHGGLHWAGISASHIAAACGKSEAEAIANLQALLDKAYAPQEGGERP